MPKRTVSRRNFIKLAGAALAGATLRPPMSALAQAALPPEDYNANAFVPLRRGRVLAPSVSVWDHIETPHDAVKRFVRDEVILLGEERSVPGTGNPHNDLWYRTRGGWVHSAWIQPMEFHDRPAIYREVGPNGFWIEVIAPKTVTREAPSLAAETKYEYIYGTVYLVTEVAVDERGGVWYDTHDEYYDKELGIEPTHHWVRAHDVRRIHESEFAAIRPEVHDKRIRVDLDAQILTCFEGNAVVLQTKVATGASFKQPDGSIADYGTPQGDHRSILKMPSRHMEHVLHARRHRHPRHVLAQRFRRGAQSRLRERADPGGEVHLLLDVPHRPIHRRLRARRRARDEQHSDRSGVSNG